MPATLLPPSGDLPERAPGTPAGPGAPVAPGSPTEAADASVAVAKTCDARGMAEIHRMFKAGFGEGRELVMGVVEGDSVHADVVADHLALLSTGLHAHHEGEDTLLWDQLQQRAPSCSMHIERMKEQHAQLLVQLTALDVAVPAWRASGRAADAAGVLAALDGVNAALAAHLPDEESNIVPVMETVITQQEVDALADHGRKATPRGKMFVQLGAILAAQPDGGDEWQREHLPPPVRILWRWVGRPKYEANRAELVGDRRP